ncbi:hypothetical protein A7K91_13615 [Paenibacillus oryzae]|uniref:Uncharacterized protein n=1 Tax=Paenibacillus oryzae TaxID=1844972 RepID=A0A1A5YJ35_9BACL|nr:hypothetical protein [Paenibacillus oryzae]OBR65617.1 hypothetical protein A7K91_13615 [Paenibacillus oryzae]
MYDMDESSSFNGFILLVLLKFFSKCTMNQVACSLYLVRFPKILARLLTKEEEMKFNEFVPEWEIGNLDALLVPYINQKYDTRFIRGIKELFARGLISIEGEDVRLTSSIEIPSKSDAITSIENKAYFSSLVVKRTEISILNEKISRIVGEEQWEIFSSSTV